MAHSDDFSGEPWSVNPAKPVITSTIATQDAPQDATHTETGYVSISRTVCFDWLSFYQHVLRSMTISHCPMYPSCSNYSIAAIHKHGALKGVILTADRLLHESDERLYAAVIKMDQRELCFDPVENNDFWWYLK